MADPHTGHIEWYSPDPRGIFPLDDFRVPVNLQREVRRGRFSIRCDTAFTQVMQWCAVPRPDDSLTWINSALIDSYTDLHRLGHAHSIEAWLGDELVGGLYGVHIGAAFFGESMFIRPDRGGTNASKICLVRLVRWLQHRRFDLLDTQFSNPHLAQFGCIEIPRNVYLTRLRRAVGRSVQWGVFTPH